MKLRRIRALAVKELLQVIRDPRSLMLALAMPVMQLFLLGYGVNLDISHVPVCVYDQEGSQFSQSLFKHVQASPYFQIVRSLRSEREIKQVMDDGTCRMVLVTPADFSRRIMLERQASVQAIVDASDDNTATLATAYANVVVAGFSSNVQLNLIERTTGTPLLPASVAEQSRVWFNEDLESRNFIIPGVVALVLALVGAQLTSLTIAREWERGTMELLISTPVTPMELLFGKLLPYFFIGMVDALICLVAAVFWFHVPFRGELTALLFTTSLFLVVVLSVGYFVSVAIPNQIGASQIALFLTIMPISLLSGYAFPIDQMPAAIRLITYGIYARYYVTILKSLFLKGSSLHDLWFPVLALAGYAAAMAWLAARAFHKRIR